MQISGRELNDTYHQADEYVSAMEILDKMNVPREDSEGQVYSLVGRIYQVMKMCEFRLYREAHLSRNDWVSMTLKKIINDK